MAKLNLGGETFRAELTLEEDFDDLRRWRRGDDHGRWTIEAGGLRGEWLSGSPSLFLREPIEGDYLWTLRAGRVRPDEAFIERFLASKHGRGADPAIRYNFNFWLRADTPDGADFFDAYPTRLGTGWNGMGDDYWKSLYCTVVRNGPANWVRLRKSPGYRKVHEAVDAVPLLAYEQCHDFAFAIRRGHVSMYFDGARVYDHEDPQPYDRGVIGLCVWLCVMRFERMRVYRLT